MHDHTDRLLEIALQGDEPALGELLQSFSERLQRMLHFRMDRRLRGRLDPADVLQEAFAVVAVRFHEYRDEAEPVPFYVWLRYLTVQKLAELHRTHLGTLARDAGRDQPLGVRLGGQDHSTILAEHFVASQTSPSQAAMRAELQMQVEQALEQMDPVDREVIALRNFEQLSNVEAASVLEIAPSAASNRYIRALKRLKQILDPEALR